MERQSAIRTLKRYERYLKIEEQQLSVQPIPNVVYEDAAFTEIKEALYTLFGAKGDDDTADYSHEVLRAGGADTIYGFGFCVPQGPLVIFRCNHGGFQEILKQVATELAYNNVNFPGSEAYRSKTVS